VYDGGGGGDGGGGDGGGGDDNVDYRLWGPWVTHKTTSFFLPSFSVQMSSSIGAYPVLHLRPPASYHSRIYL
jgi:hypothetical protein